ncbi:MAG: hypothetical protein IMZ61_06410 [Planctomycetes bacterium]|nr:hypothetical protein [Thermoplasmata archaeon]MBE3143539.1 hypothetical protein [Planctomycetota bacterium]
MDNEQKILESHGYVWKEFKTDSPVRKRKYYTPDGREVVLPADPYSLNQYLSKGFTLTPPVIQAIPEAVIETTEISSEKPLCPECGYEAKDHVGLAIHRRKTHNPKKYHKTSTRRIIEPIG